MYLLPAAEGAVLECLGRLVFALATVQRAKVLQCRGHRWGVNLKFNLNLAFGFDRMNLVFIIQIGDS